MPILNTFVIYQPCLTPVCKTMNQVLTFFGTVCKANFQQSLFFKTLRCLYSALFITLDFLTILKMVVVFDL